MIATQRKAGRGRPKGRDYPTTVHFAISPEMLAAVRAWGDANEARSVSDAIRLILAKTLKVRA